MTAIMAAWGHKHTSTSKNPLPGWLWPAVILSVFAFGMLYAAVIYASGALVWKQTLGRRLGFEILVHRPGDTNIPQEMVAPLEESKLDGTRCRLSLHVRMRLCLIERHKANTLQLTKTPKKVAKAWNALRDFVDRRLLKKR